MKIEQTNLSLPAQYHLSASQNLAENLPSKMFLLIATYCKYLDIDGWTEIVIGNDLYGQIEIAKKEWNSKLMRLHFTFSIWLQTT